MTAGFLGRPGPRWFNIPAHRPFADDLAKGLYEALAVGGPEALSEATVLVPTRRGARALADAFIRASGGRAVLPPQMRPLGDLEAGEPPFEPGDLALDLPAAIEPLRRRFELTRIVADNWDLLRGRELTASAALELGDALGHLADSLQIEEVELGDRLDALVEGELAEHWQVSRDFLKATLAAWPKRLADLGLVDVSERRVRLLRRLAETWTLKPPMGVLVAAGSTGTAPATRALLKAVAEAPQGCVVLPGLDHELADSAWGKIDVQHPQGALKRLLDDAHVRKDQVDIWPVSAAPDMRGRWRRRIVNEALRPAHETKDWLQVIDALRREGGGDPIAVGLSGLSLVSARTEEETATVAALLLREALETPEKTAALVTPDQTLARRVSAKLARWGVVPDSSAGQALAGCPCGVLAGLVARAAVDPLDPVNLLAILKHPYVPAEPEALSTLERRGLRGARPQDWEALRARLAGHPAARDLADWLHAALAGLCHSAAKPPDKKTAEDAEKAQSTRSPPRPSAPSAPSPRPLRLDATPAASLASDGTAPPSAFAATLARTMESLSREPGVLWSGDGGEAMSRLLSGLIHDAEGLPPVTPRGFADLLERLTEGETVRSGGATHPRLRILGAIEARLVRADRLVLAGLEEGVWPRGAPIDPFLSRPMRETLGLPSPERRVGLAAHDFAQAACAPEVVLLHSERREGAPSVKSRWLWRLETLASGAGATIPSRPEVLEWARALDAPDAYEPYPRPAPKPPVEDRPKGLFVTRVEALTRDPYAVWARDILGLRQLDRPDEPVDVRARGTAIHLAFERFAERHPGALPADGAAIFKDLYLEALREKGMPAEALAREAALATGAADWVMGLEAERRADGRAIHVEGKGSVDLLIDGEPFTLSAKADRIEIGSDGLGHVLDYKTGKAPSPKMVRTGFSPQLTLTAAILARGGFEGLPAAQPGELVYLEVTGRDPPGKVEVRAAPDGDGEKVLVSDDAVEGAVEGLANLVRRFRDPGRGYASRTAPQFVKLYASDYDHLARVFEWSTSGEEEGE